MQEKSSCYIGLMSGTSLDGVDGVLVSFSEDQGATLHLHASAHVPFSIELKRQAMQLQQAGENEIEREALLANQLVRIYADCVHALCRQCPEVFVQAIGVHGQTIRHRPDLGFTRQTNNPALLAELTGIDVIADFRSRDIAAGGQGAPLVPAFHRAMFAKEGECRVVLNIGGISNISALHADGRTIGFDTGPGNLLMDAWIHQHHGLAYDVDGAWAAQGQTHDALLASLCDEDFFKMPPPKSTGRDLFHSSWLQAKLAQFATLSPVDVQASLCSFTAATISDAIAQFAPDCQAVYVCGGGAYNQTLMQQLADRMPCRQIDTTDSLGIAANHVEAIAFAWLAQRFVQRKTANLSEVTAARGARILGALYPA
ncbi:anhydro-N-acetylmuramic acid kinase [Undibacterium baiyunense]|uniref:Anhydro-N-acetylmuramic acid kinase n=1 Tax=Undibacterium baiyunense TaxID=2828731 RepID=A0A941DFF9_9BURK|nr:anhydro-N-acetylmuramic acid kinase [Undibacterium baiyunense]MBR7747160.1 anhydro-N-acetylmuramic acid kinase [Undibacterium baiyunense]